jgi:hypothetical protein
LYRLDKPFSDYSRYNQIHERALVQYADTNKDGIVSAREKETFDVGFRRYVAREYGVKFVSDYFVDRDGRKVALTEVSDWLKSYKPNN